MPTNNELLSIDIEDVPLPCAICDNSSIVGNKDFLLLTESERFTLHQMAKDTLLDNKNQTQRRHFNLSTNPALITLRTLSHQRILLLIEPYRHIQSHVDDIVFKHSGEAIIITDQNDDIVRVNDAFTSLLGYSSDESMLRSPQFLRDGINHTFQYDKMLQLVRKVGHWNGEVIVRRSSGEPLHTWQSTSVIRHNNEIQGYISVFSDISQHIDEVQNMRHLAYHDHLTGLPNRLLLEDRFQQIIRHLKQDSHETTCFAIVFFDLDDFKRINDECGHATGDQALSLFAQALNQTIENKDTAARISGDEFVLILENFTHREEENVFLENLGKNLKQSLKELTLPSSLSIDFSSGFAYYPEDGTTLKALLSCADKKMYEMKRSIDDASQEHLASN